MNWDIFSLSGYASIALWLCMPLLWLLHLIMGRRGWLIHLSLLLGLFAFVLGRMNSDGHVNRIQVDRSEQIEQQLARQELARQAATEARENEVAQIRFAEDGADDFLDAAGMDEADLKYMQSFVDGGTPEWKTEKRQRSADSIDDSLESQIGAKETRQAMQAKTLVESEPLEPILMSDSDKRLADRLDAANLMMIRVMIGLGMLFVVVDYLRRANNYDLAYWPLPLPSSWVDAITPRDPVTIRSPSPRRSLFEELRVLIQRGESFLYVTEDSEAASQATTTLCRLPWGRWPVEVLNVADFDGSMNDDFVFETLWYGRHSFVVNSLERAEPMLMRFMELMADRRTTRARVKQTVNIVWDVPTPPGEETRHRFAKMGSSTGFTLLICHKQPQENSSDQDCRSIP